MKRILNVLSILMVFVFALAIGSAMADDLSAMLKKLKSSDRMEMRTPTSVAAARGMQQKDNLRNEAQTESMRASIRESIQSAAAEEMRTAEFEFGKVCKDVHGEWVRLEEYVKIAPDGNANQFKLMILNERNNGERLDYFTNLSTFNDDLPTDPAQFAAVAKNMWSSTTAPDLYLTNVYNLAANDYEDKVEWTYSNGTSRLSNGKYVPVFKDYVYKIGNKEDGMTTKLSYTGNNPDGNDRAWTVPNPDGVGAALINGSNTDAFQTWMNDNTVTSTTDDGGYKYETEFSGSVSATETYYFIDDNGDVTNPNTNDNWNQELIFGASEFSGRTIDLVIAPDVFEQSGIGYIK